MLNGKNAKREKSLTKIKKTKKKKLQHLTVRIHLMHLVWNVETFASITENGYCTKVGSEQNWKNDQSVANSGFMTNIIGNY